MPYTCTLRKTTYQFDGLKEVLAKASPLRSGDQLAGVAADSAEERVAAQLVLADVPLRTFLEAPTVADMALVIVNQQAKRAGPDRVERLLSEIEALSDEQVRRGMGTNPREANQP